MKTGIPVECVLCRKYKKPIGRSGPMEMQSSLCDDDCGGYRQEPFPGSLWPGETEEEFGYPVGLEGTEERGEDA